MATTVWRTLDESAIAGRQAGRLLIQEQTIPASAPVGSYVSLKIDQSEADRENPAIVYTMHLEREVSNGVWTEMCGQNWVGVEGAPDPETGEPYICQCAVAIVTRGNGGNQRTKRGWRVRGRLELPQSLSLGWRLEILTFE